MNDKPDIFKPKKGKSLSQFTNELAEILKNKNVIFYNLTTKNIVRLALNSLNKNNEYEEKIIGMLPLTPKDFITLVEEYADIVIEEKNKNGEFYPIISSMTSEQASVVLSSEEGFKMKIPLLDKIFSVPMPVFLNNQLLLLKKGYNELHHIWLTNDAPEINDDVKLEDAKKVIEKIFEEFCFVSEQDKFNTYAYLFTPFIRELYNRNGTRTPLFIIMANRERAGKDYLAGILGIIYEGASVEYPPISTGKEVNEEELRKRILSIIASGRTRMHSANNTGLLRSAVLEWAITNSRINDRLLGKNIIIEGWNNMELSLSANVGLSYSPDIKNRAIFINLSFMEEDPNNRKFKNPDLHRWVFENRSLILSAMFKIVNNWVENGSKSSSKLFTSFPEWMRIIGGIMENVNWKAPTSNDILNEIGGDRETEDMKLLFTRANKKYGNEWIEKAVLMEEFDSAGIFEDLFGWLNVGEKSGKTSIGIKFKKFKGRILNNIVLEVLEVTNSYKNKYRFKDLNENKIKKLDLNGKEVICPTCGLGTTRLYEKNKKWLCDLCLNSTEED